MPETTLLESESVAANAEELHKRWSEAEETEYYLMNEALSNEGGNTVETPCPRGLIKRWSGLVASVPAEGKGLLLLPCVKVRLSEIGGQTVRSQVEAADASTASLVEAAVDDVKVVQQP